MATKTGPLAAATAYANKPALKVATLSYLDLLDKSYLPGQRLERILDFLKGKHRVLRDAAATVRIHPVAIAAAIAWEFSQNEWGYLTDEFVTIGKQEGWGFGSFHRETLKNFLGLRTEEEVYRIRSDPDRAIDVIARYTAKQRDDFRTNSGGIDLSDWPAGLAWLYNTNPEYVASAAQRKKDMIEAGAVPRLQVINDLAGWTEMHLDRFDWLKAKSKLPGSPVKYERTVREDKIEPKYSERAIF